MADERKHKPDGIVCPICRKTLGVVETRTGNGYLRRRRVCNDYKCSGKITTIEIPTHDGAKISGVVMLPKDLAERLLAALSAALGPTIEGTDDEPVSPGA